MPKENENPYRVFHSPCEQLRKRIHVILVRPSEGGNVGATIRALENMGVFGSVIVAGNPDILNEESRKFAVNAQERLENIEFHEDLKAALDSFKEKNILSLASTARVGSSHRPHPTWIRKAMSHAIEKLVTSQITDIVMVFGCEASGLSNFEVSLCDQVVTIPSVSQYRSLNLAQAILIFAYEANMLLLSQPEASFKGTEKPTQKAKMVQHLIRLAEESGFVLPGDPFKMKPKLEEIFAPIPLLANSL